MSFGLVGICFFTLGYLGVAFVCCIETLIENHHSRKRVDNWLAAGLLLSLCWPLLIIAALVDALLRRTSSAGFASRSISENIKPFKIQDPTGRIEYDTV